jgi:hypothetical protein
LCLEGENIQPANAKKPCTNASEKEKPKSNPSKDTQSVAAKVSFYFVMIYYIIHSNTT